MAYATKYRFRGQSVMGYDITVTIDQDGYSGAVLDRPMGKAPILRREENGRVRGTSFELYAECKIDGEYAEFYTSNPFEFRVTVKRNNVNIWRGFISPELYSEPDIAPPYDVQIIAVDGLGELKLRPYELQGRQSLRSIFDYILAGTGVSASGTYYMGELAPDGVTAAQFLANTYVDLSYIEDKNCYEVLTSLLESMCAYITYDNLKWVVMRETDLTLTGSGALLRQLKCYNAYSYAASNIYSMSYGQRGSHRFWPVGQLSTEVIPAKNKQAVLAPFHFRPTILQGSDFSDAAVWTISGSGVTIDTVAKLVTFTGTGNIGQSYAASNDTPGLTLRILAAQGTAQAKQSVWLRVWAVDTVSQDFYIYMNGGWAVNGDFLHWEQVGAELNSIDPAVSDDYTEILVELPPFTYGNIDSFNIQIMPGGSPALNSMYLKEVDLYKTAQPKGYRDTIIVNNDARGEGEEVELAVAHSGEVDQRFLYGVLANQSGSEFTTWTDKNFTSRGSFLSIIAAGYAMTEALPRLRKTGTLFTEGAGSSTPAVPPALFDDSGLVWIVNEYEWNLLEDECQIELTSAPNAVLSVVSETIAKVFRESGGSGGSSGGGGGGGGGGTVTSVGLTVPTGLTVTGSPVTGSGTIAVGLDTGRTIPMAADVNKGTTAYGWGDHASAGYATENYVDSAIAGIPGLTAQLQPAPRLVIRRGVDKWGNYREYIQVYHPMLGGTGYEAVLMVYAKRNGHRTGMSAHNTATQIYKKGWCVARGSAALTDHTETMTFVGTSGLAVQELDLIRDYIVKRYTSDNRYSPIWIFANMDYVTWVSDTTQTNRGFAGRHTRNNGYKRFGIAVRYLNPAFTALVQGELSEYTQEIDGVPRYLYSDVAPLDAYFVSDPHTGNKRRMMFGLKGD